MGNKYTEPTFVAACAINAARYKSLTQADELGNYVYIILLQYYQDNTLLKNCFSILFERLSSTQRENNLSPSK